MAVLDPMHLLLRTERSRTAWLPSSISKYTASLGVGDFTEESHHIANYKRDVWFRKVAFQRQIWIHQVLISLAFCCPLYVRLSDHIPEMLRKKGY